MAGTENELNYKDYFCVRTITVFVQLTTSDFLEPAAAADAVSDDDDVSLMVHQKISAATKLLRLIETSCAAEGYTVQTTRIATNPFGEWIHGLIDGTGQCKGRYSSAVDVLTLLDTILASHKIDFCSLGPAKTREDVLNICPTIVRSSPRFSCSADLSDDVDPSTMIDMAAAAAQCIRRISQLGQNDDNNDDDDEADDNNKHICGGLGNFRFCVAASCQPHIPFFPAARAQSISSAPSSSNRGSTFVLKFALGLENGALAHHLLTQCQTIGNIHDTFRTGVIKALQPLQSICERGSRAYNDANTATRCEYVGIDTSLNPSLTTPHGSVAAAIECLREVHAFAGPGTLAAAAALTRALQSLEPTIKLCGYCGIMLPLCEDHRLAQLAAATTPTTLRIADLLSISHVCGVGVDTVPLAGDSSVEEITSLLLDVAAVAHRWKKALSCRVFPVPRKTVHETTTFDSPYMVNTCILPIS